MIDETDQSEERDLHLLALVMLHEVELEMRADELRILALAGLTAGEARAYLRLEGKAVS